MRSLYTSISSLLLRSEAVRQSFVMSIGNVVTAGLMAVAMILAARALGPEDFGIFSIVVSVMFIFSIVTDFGLHQLIPRLFHRWEEKKQLQNLFMQWMYKWKIRLSLLLLIVSGVTVPVLQSVLGINDPVLLWFALLGAILLGWYEFVHLALSSLHKFTAVSLLTVLQALVKCIGFIFIVLVLMDSVEVFGFLEPFRLGTFSIDAVNLLRIFVGIYCVAPITSLVWSSVFNTWQANQNSEANNLKAQFQTISKAVWRFLPHAAVGTVTMILIQNVDILLVNNQLNTFETGIYAGALRVTMVISLFTFAISSVLNNRITRYNTIERISSYLIKSLALTLVSLIGFIVFIPFAQPILTLTIGPEYLSGLIPFIILIGNAFLGLALVPYTSFFFRLDVPWANSVGGLLQLVPLLGLNILFLQRYGLVVASLARVGGTLLFACLVIYLVWRSWKKAFSDAVMTEQAEEIVY